MNKCTKCGREFKTPQALGGHMRGGHKEETQEGSSEDNHSVILRTSPIPWKQSRSQLGKRP